MLPSVHGSTFINEIWHDDWLLILICGLLKQYYNCHNICHQQLVTSNLPENPISTALQLAKNCCQSYETVADLWQAH
jgi:hypothetical protein